MGRGVLLSADISASTEFEWAIAVAFYFHVLALYKQSAAKSSSSSSAKNPNSASAKMVIKFARRALALIDKELAVQSDAMAMDMADDVDVDALQQRVQKYGRVHCERARKLCEDAQRQQRQIGD